LIIAQQPWHKFCCIEPRVELIRQNSLAHSIRQSDNVANIVNRSSSVFQDSLSHFCHFFGRGYSRRPSKTLFIIYWYPSVLGALKPFVGLRLAYSVITKCFLKHSVCVRSRLAEFEAEFDASPLLLHINHFSRSPRSQNSTNTTSRKCTEKRHTHPHSRTPLGRMIHRGQSSRYLAAHNCTTSDFRATFKFRERLGSSVLLSIQTNEVTKTTQCCAICNVLYTYFNTIESIMGSRTA
jgi:hypothetical protein